jgi:acid phosphatase family membrane protein YuiD
MASPAAVLSVLVKADGIAKTNAQLQGLHGDLGKSSKAAGRLGTDLDRSTRTGSKALAGLKSAAGLAGLAVGAAGLAGAVKASIGEYREAQKVGAQTNAVIKSTGGAANVSAKHVGDLATAISKKAGIDDEAIQSGENLLLTFKGVRNETGKGNDVFNQATQTITDMSVSLKQGLKPSAIQVGKALNDPVKGITALGRVGVQFTEGQKKMIAGLVKSGDTLGAQKIILKELKSEFGGSAAAAATAGDHLKVSFGNLEEALGAVLVPAIDKVATVLSALFDQMVQNKGIGGRWSPRSSRWAVRSARSSA